VACDASPLRLDHPNRAVHVGRSVLALAFTSLFITVPQLAAQQVDPVGPLRTAVSATKPMTRVRVELYGGRRMTGTLLAADATGLTIESDSGPRLQVPYVDVARYWDRRRAVKAGAITGGILGAGAGAFFGMLVVGLCEYDCGTTSLTQGAIVGGLAVGAAGAVAGAVVGAAIPRWSQRWRASRYLGPPPGAGSVPVTAAPAPQGDSTHAPHQQRRREIGEVTLFGIGGYGGYPSGIYGGGSDTRGFIGGAAAALGFRMGQVAFGPQLGFLGGVDQVVEAQWIFRVDLADRRRPGSVPYVIAGAGANMWSAEFNNVAYFTGSFGAGLTFGSRHQWRTEARWQPVLQYSSSGPHPTLITAGIGRRFSW